MRNTAIPTQKSRGLVPVLTVAVVVGDSCVVDLSITDVSGDSKEGFGIEKIAPLAVLPFCWFGRRSRAGSARKERLRDRPPVSEAWTDVEGARSVLGKATFRHLGSAGIHTGIGKSKALLHF